MAKEIFPGVIVDPQVVHGRPVIAGTRIPVEVVVGALAGGSSFEEIMDDYHLSAALPHADGEPAPRTGVIRLNIAATNREDGYPGTGIDVSHGQCQAFIG